MGTGTLEKPGLRSQSRGSCLAANSSPVRFLSYWGSLTGVSWRRCNMPLTSQLLFSASTTVVSLACFGERSGNPWDQESHCPRVNTQRAHAACLGPGRLALPSQSRAEGPSVVRVSRPQLPKEPSRRLRDPGGRCLRDGGRRPGPHSHRQPRSFLNEDRRSPRPSVQVCQGLLMRAEAARLAALQ